MSRWWRMSVGAAVAAVVGLALTGCGGGEPDPAQSSPDGGVYLQENIPTPVGDLTVIASNIWDDSIALVVNDGDGPAETVGVSVGETVTVKGRDFELVSIYEDPSDEDAEDGGLKSYAWVVPLG